MLVPIYMLQIVYRVPYENRYYHISRTLKKNSLHVSSTKMYAIPGFPLNKNIITKVVCTKLAGMKLLRLLNFAVEHFQVGL